MTAVAEKPKDKEQLPAAEGGTDKVAEDVALGKPAMAFIERSLGITGRKKKEDKPKPEEKAAAPEAKEDDAELDNLHKKPEPKKPAAKPAAKPTPPPVQQFDEEKLGEAVGRQVAKAIEKNKPAAPPEPELPADVKAELAKYERLEKHFPDKYKGHAKKYLTNAQKFTEYSENWEKNHPGQEFNDADPEHETFRSSLEAETEYDEDDNVTALANEIADGKVAKVKEEFEQKLDPIRRREKIAEKRSEIVANRDKVGNRFWERMGDNFSNVLDENGQLKPAALTELKATDPIAHDAAVNGAAFVENMATEVFLLDNALVDFRGDEPITPSTKPEVAEQIRRHKFLSDFSIAAEQRMASRPTEKQLDDQGRRFLPRSDYGKLSAKERDKYWTFSFEDLGYLIAAQIAKQTQAHLLAEEEKFNSRAKARGLLKDEQSLPSKSQRQPVIERELEEEQDEKPLSPTTPVAPRLASSRGKPALTPTGPLEGFALRSIRGR